MAIGSFRGQLEGAISKRLSADPYAKRQQAAQADYQAQAEKSRQDLSERLNRLGVLRGSGKTASQFGEFEAGVLRGQQAIGAQFEAQRDAGVSQAIQQGIGMYGTTSQAGIAGRQQSEAERMGRFSRDLSTRQYLSQDALNRDRQREAERAAQVQEGFQRAGVTGLYDGQRTVDQQRQDLSYRLGLSEMLGQEIAGVQGQTEARRARGQQEAFQQAGITGQFDGDRTLAAQQLYGAESDAEGAPQTMQQQELSLRRGELLGEIGEDRRRTLAAQQALGEIDGQDTLARDALQQEALQASMERGLRRTEGLAERNLRSSQASLDRRAASDMQAAQFGEAALEREARATEAELGRDLAREELMGFREIDGRREQTLAAREAGAQRRLTEAEGRRERESRAAMQQAQFGQETSQAALARTLAREELYGSANPMEWDRTLASTGQRAQIAAENRRLAEMEAAGASQREMAIEAARMREAELMGYTEDASGRRQQTLGAREAQAQRGLEARRLTEMERAGLAGEDLRRTELYGQDVSGMSPLEIQALGGTLASREAQAGREFARGESALEREQRGTLASQERALRGRLSAAELGSRERLAEGEITSREGQAALDRTLAREGTAEQSRLQEINLYGRELSEAERGMIESGRGGPSTLAARDLTQRGGQFDRELTSREGIAAAERQARALEGGLSRGLAREEMYGRGMTADEIRAGRYEGDTLATRELTSREGMAAQERALRGRLSAAEIGSREGLAARDITSREEQNRFQRDLAREEMYGGEMGMRTGRTIASRDQLLRAELGRGGLEVDRDRLSLAEEELYGGVGRRELSGSTLASREADRAAGFERERLGYEGERIGLAREAGEREAFRNQLAEEELYGTSQRRGATFQALEADRGRTERQLDRDQRATSLSYEQRRVNEMERSGRAQRGIQRRELDYRQEQLAIDNALRAIGITQSTEAGYRASDEERAIIQRMLGGAAGPNVGGYGHPVTERVRMPNREGMFDETTRLPEGYSGQDPMAAELTEEEAWNIRNNPRARSVTPTPRDGAYVDEDGNIVQNPWGLTYSGW